MVTQVNFNNWSRTNGFPPRARHLSHRDFRWSCVRARQIPAYAGMTSMFCGSYVNCLVLTKLLLPLRGLTMTWTWIYLSINDLELTWAENFSMHFLHFRRPWRSYSVNKDIILPRSMVLCLGQRNGAVFSFPHLFAQALPPADHNNNSHISSP